MSLLLALAGAVVEPPAPPPAPPPSSIGGGVPLYLYRRNPDEQVKPRKSRRRRLNEALIVSRSV